MTAPSEHPPGLEDISEYRGYFVASYVVEGDQEYIGYAKVCWCRPETVWDAPDARAKVCSQVRPNRWDALIHAKIAAFSLIDDAFVD